MLHNFKAGLEIIGVNPFVFVPSQILLEIFTQAIKDKGHIPVCVIIKGNKHKQT